MSDQFRNYEVFQFVCTDCGPQLDEKGRLVMIETGPDRQAVCPKCKKEYEVVKAGPHA